MLNTEQDGGLNEQETPGGKFEHENVIGFCGETIGYG
jgi:hypothetical protein